MVEKLKSLIDVKSIITILLTLVVAYKAIRGEMDIEQLYLMIIAFYFGTQSQKKNVSLATTETTESTNVTSTNTTKKSEGEESEV